MDIQYSIRDLENMSGIKAHTLRIWEQRYNFINPKRTETNIRYYNGNDLKLILKVALLNQNGYKISKIAKMSEELMATTIISMQSIPENINFQITSLTTAMVDLEEDKFEKIVNNSISHNGFEFTMINLIYPFLQKIGILWLSNSINPAQEHFISNLVRQKLIIGIEQLKYKKINEAKPHYLLFLPEGELHELGLLFAHYILKAREYRVTYLGASVPTKDATMVAKLKSIDIAFLIMTSFPKKRKMQEFVSTLSEQMGDFKVMATGSLAQKIDFPLPENFKILSSVQGLVNLEDNEINEPFNSK